MLISLSHFFCFFFVFSFLFRLFFVFCFCFCFSFFFFFCFCFCFVFLFFFFLEVHLIISVVIIIVIIIAIILFYCYFYYYYCFSFKYIITSSLFTAVLPTTQPNILVDLMWRAHMLSPLDYAADSVWMHGRVVDHVSRRFGSSSLSYFSLFISYALIWF